MTPTSALERQRDDDQPGADKARVRPGGRRDRLRTNPATRHTYRVGVFFAGLMFILAGLALAVLPGPLTIPPVLVGLWIWSWEFAFAHRFFESFKEKADDAWEHAKARPKSSALITATGLILAGVAMWAVVHYALIAKAKDVVGL